MCGLISARVKQNISHTTMFGPSGLSTTIVSPATVRGQVALYQHQSRAIHSPILLCAGQTDFPEYQSRASDFFYRCVWADQRQSTANHFAYYYVWTKRL